LSTCLLFSGFIQGLTKDSRDKDETAKFDSKFSSKSDLEKRKQTLQVNLKKKGKKNRNKKPLNNSIHSKKRKSVKT
jgi:hypothetical protein